MSRRLAVCVLLGTLIACSEPPDKEHQQAIGALEAARAAGAETYAPVEFHDAESALMKYDAAVAQRDFRQALNTALEARDLAYDAAKQAANKKAEQRSQSERLTAELETLIGTATDRLSGPGRLTGAAGTRLRTSRDAARKVLQEAGTRSGAENYQGAVAILTPAIANLGRDLSGADAPAAKRKK